MSISREMPAHATPVGTWTTSGTPNRATVERVRPLLEAAFRDGVTRMSAGGFTWTFVPLDPDPLDVTPRDRPVIDNRDAVVMWVLAAIGVLLVIAGIVLLVLGTPRA